MAKKKVETVVIVGTGLIGGSIGRAIRKKKLAKKVIGVGRRNASLKEAKRAGAIDEGTLKLEKAAAKADLIILASSVASIPALAKKVAQVKKDSCVVTDVASVKTNIVRICEPLFRGTFIGGHPMAGSEKKGAKYSNEKLFKNSICILTPTNKTKLNTINLVASLWKQLGAKVVRLTPKKHDQVTASVSHIPHLMAAILILSQGKTDREVRNVLKFAGNGFRDMTRIASGDPALWSEILMANKKNVIGTMDTLLAQLKVCRRLLQNSDASKTRQTLNRAKKMREKFI